LVRSCTCSTIDLCNITGPISNEVGFLRRSFSRPSSMRGYFYSFSFSNSTRISAEAHSTDTSPMRPFFFHVVHPLMGRVLLLGRRRRRHPSLDTFADLTEPMKAKRPTVSTLRPIRCKTKTYNEVAPSRGLVQRVGPRRIRPIVTGPARLSALQARFVKAFQ
jgi:hypothetical protein